MTMLNMDSLMLRNEDGESCFKNDKHMTFPPRLTFLGGKVMQGNM